MTNEQETNNLIANEVLKIFTTLKMNGLKCVKLKWVALRVSMTSTF